MATLLSSLRTRIQLTLNDAGAGTWADATVDAWICEAIRDYSQYFPRTRKVSTLISNPASRTHNLHTDYIAMILVEYPTGETPPKYLTHRPRTHPQFYDYEGYYDVEPSNDQDNQGTFFLSVLPTYGEYFALTYLAPHDSDLSAAQSDEITVPVEHEYLLELFVLWTAFKERVATHLQDPDTTSDILQKMVNAEQQAHEEYRRAIRNAEKHRSQAAITGPWRADIHDPIY